MSPDSAPSTPRPLAPLATDILAFWFGPLPHRDRDVWFRKDDAFDREIGERFGTALAVLHVAALHMSAAPALLIALAVAVGWNAMLTLLRRKRA